MKQHWWIATVGADFVWRMEDVLDLYAQPYDPLRPVICFDELPYQVLRDVLEPQPCAPGRPAREDYEYAREGMCNLFLRFQPQQGWRHIDVTERRTSQDVACHMQALVDVHVPDAEVIHVVLDNLNTHPPAALYQTFPPAEAQRLTQTLAFHYTPKHGSWLNMVEIEWSVVVRQCLDQRLPDRGSVQQAVNAWVERRNAYRASVDWRFTVHDARTKLVDRYPPQP